MPTPALSRAGLDRAAAGRRDPGWLTAAWAAPDARVLVVDEQRRVLVEPAPGGPRLRYLPPAAAPGGERYLLGVDPAGRSHWAVPGPLPQLPGSRVAGLREVGAELGDTDAGALVLAVALANWHATHPRCPRCGAATEVAWAGFLRRCPADGSEHFPRTDPAVIVLVSDGAEHCLLGRQPSWPAGRFSTLAGFVEPGESAEQAVTREVAEEAGVPVREIRYHTSQPWPFPASLMLAFTAVADRRPPQLTDGELAEARWFTRAELRAGGVRLPPPVSVAHRLISNWLVAGSAR